MFAFYHQAQAQDPYPIKFFMQTGEMHPHDLVFNGNHLVEARSLDQDTVVQISYDSDGSKQCRVCHGNRARGQHAYMAQGLPVCMAQGPPVCMAQGPHVCMAQGPPVCMAQGLPARMFQGPPVCMAQGLPARMFQGIAVCDVDPIPNHLTNAGVLCGGTQLTRCPACQLRMFCSSCNVCLQCGQVLEIGDRIRHGPFAGMQRH